MSFMTRTSPACFQLSNVFPNVPF
uniref:Uncharacterized protein n=1 Tax=Anguilla anguilla TaxID=7936 RepID=A0A0E9XBZ5_ANGAN